MTTNIYNKYIKYKLKYLNLKKIEFIYLISVPNNECIKLRWNNSKFLHIIEGLNKDSEITNRIHNIKNNKEFIRIAYKSDNPEYNEIDILGGITFWNFSQNYDTYIEAIKPHIYTQILFYIPNGIFSDIIHVCLKQHISTTFTGEDFY